MTKKKPFYIEVLERGLEQRKARNARFSLRGYATFLEIDSSSLSSIIKHKRTLPKSKILPFADKLELTGEERKKFVESAELEFASLGALKESFDDHTQIDLEDDLGARIFKHWEYFALFALLATKDDPMSIDWISERLNLDADDVTELVQDMVEAKLIFEKEGGYVKKEGPLSYKENPPTPKSLIEAQLDNFEMITRRLKDEGEEFFNLCDVTSTTFSADPSKKEAAVKIIQEFRRKISKFMAQDDNSEVYQLSIQLVPLTKKK